MILIVVFAFVPVVFLMWVASLVYFALVSRQDPLTPTAGTAGARHARRAAGLYVRSAIGRETDDNGQKAHKAVSVG